LPSARQEQEQVQFRTPGERRRVQVLPNPFQVENSTLDLAGGCIITNNHAPHARSQSRRRHWVYSIVTGLASQGCWQGYSLHMLHALLRAPLPDVQLIVVFVGQRAAGPTPFVALQQSRSVPSPEFSARSVQPEHSSPDGCGQAVSVFGR